MVKSAVYDAVGLSIFVLMTDALTRANASISVRGWRSAVACNRLRYAPYLTLQTLCVDLLFILDLHYAEQPYSILCLSIFVLMTDALTRANASISVSRSAFGGCLQTLAFSFNSFDAFNYFSEFLLKIYVY